LHQTDIAEPVDVLRVAPFPMHDDARKTRRYQVRTAVGRSVVDHDHPRPHALLCEARLERIEHRRGTVVVHDYDRNRPRRPPELPIDDALRVAWVIERLHRRSRKCFWAEKMQGTCHAGPKLE